MGLFSKNVDYNLILEQVLDKKNFSANTKNILLSMFYKIESSYKDYQNVKKIYKTKDEFLKEIIQIVKENLDSIKTVEPESEESAILRKNDIVALTNFKERSALIYPTEISMLYAISDIKPKYFYMENYLFKRQFQELLVNAENNSWTEIIEDFNGWSWNPKPLNDKNCFYNVIHQNLNYILGEERYKKCKDSSSKDYDIVKILQEEYNEYYNNLTKVIYVYYKKDVRKIVKAKIEKNENEDEIKFLQQLINSKQNLEQSVFELQKSFIKIIKQKIKELKTRENFIDIIYMIRYYKNLYLTKDFAIKNYEILGKELNRLLREIITLACQKGYVKMLSLNININAKMWIKILDSKTLGLEDLKITVEQFPNTILVDVFENQTFEKRFEINFKVENPEILIKKKHTVKVFN